MTIGTIIMIVLGITVLVFLIFGFSSGWNNMWDRITAFGGGGANVDTIKQACVLACTSQSENDYCVRERTMKFGEERDIEKTDGTELKEQKSVSGSCEVLANDYKLGVEKCPNLC